MCRQYCMAFTSMVLTEITKSLVDEVVQELIEEQAMAYQNYCAWLTENQQMLLLAVAESEPGIFAIEPAVYQHPPSTSHKQREDGIKGIGG